MHSLLSPATQATCSIDMTHPIKGDKPWVWFVQSRILRYFTSTTLTPINQIISFMLLLGDKTYRHGAGTQCMLLITQKSFVRFCELEYIYYALINTLIEVIDCSSLDEYLGNFWLRVHLQTFKANQLQLWQNKINGTTIPFDYFNRTRNKKEKMV